MSEPVKTTSSEKNARRSRRLGTSALAKVECRSGALGLGPDILHYPLDISETGIRVVLKKHVAKGREIEVTMQSAWLPRSLKRLADVVWSISLPDGTCCVGLLFKKNLSYREAQALGRNFP